MKEAFIDSKRSSLLIPWLAEEHELTPCQEAAMLIQFANDGQQLQEGRLTKRNRLCYRMRRKYQALYRIAAWSLLFIHMFEYPVWIARRSNNAWQNGSIYPSYGMPYLPLWLSSCLILLCLAVLWCAIGLEFGYKRRTQHIYLTVIFSIILAVQTISSFISLAYAVSSSSSSEGPLFSTNFVCSFAIILVEQRYENHIGYFLRLLPRFAFLMVGVTVVICLWTTLGFILFPPLSAERSSYFADYGTALWNMLMVLNGSDWPSPMMPAVDVNRAYVVYFFLYLMAVDWGCLNLVLGFIYLFYRIEDNDIQVKLAAIHQASYRQAFLLLLADGGGQQAGRSGGSGAATITAVTAPSIARTSSPTATGRLTYYQVDEVLQELYVHYLETMHPPNEEERYELLLTCDRHTRGYIHFDDFLLLEETCFLHSLRTLRAKKKKFQRYVTYVEAERSISQAVQHGRTLSLTASRRGESLSFSRSLSIQPLGQSQLGQSQLGPGPGMMRSSGSLVPRLPSLSVDPETERQQQQLQQLEVEEAVDSMVSLASNYGKIDNQQLIEHYRLSLLEQQQQQVVAAAAAGLERTSSLVGGGSFSFLPRSFTNTSLYNNNNNNNNHAIKNNISNNNNNSNLHNYITSSSSRHTNDLLAGMMQQQAANNTNTSQPSSSFSCYSCYSCYDQVLLPLGQQLLLLRSRLLILVDSILYDILSDLLLALLAILCLVEVSCRSSYLAFLLLSLAECCSKLAVKGLHRYWKSYRKSWDGAVTVMLLCILLGQTYVQHSQLYCDNFALQSLLLLRLLLLPRNLVTKVFTSFRQRHRLAIRFAFQSGQQILFLLLMMLAWLYAFSSLGCQLFGGTIVTAGARGEAIGESLYGQRGYWPLNFNDLPSALVTMFVLLHVNNMHVTTSGLVAATNLWAEVFFAAWYSLGVLLLLNILTAVIINQFLRYLLQLRSQQLQEEVRQLEKSKQEQLRRQQLHRAQLNEARVGRLTKVIAGQGQGPPAASATWLQRMSSLMVSGRGGRRSSSEAIDQSNHSVLATVAIGSRHVGGGIGGGGVAREAAGTEAGLADGPTAPTTTAAASSMMMFGTSIYASSSYRRELLQFIRQHLPGARYDTKADVQPGKTTNPLQQSTAKSDSVDSGITSSNFLHHRHPPTKEGAAGGAPSSSLGVIREISMSSKGSQASSLQQAQQLQGEEVKEEEGEKKHEEEEEMKKEQQEQAITTSRSRALTATTSSPAVTLLPSSVPSIAASTSLASSYKARLSRSLLLLRAEYGDTASLLHSAEGPAGEADDNEEEEEEEVGPEYGDTASLLHSAEGPAGEEEMVTLHHAAAGDGQTPAGDSGSSATSASSSPRAGGGEGESGSSSSTSSANEEKQAVPVSTVPLAAVADVLIQSDLLSASTTYFNKQLRPVYTSPEEKRQALHSLVLAYAQQTHYQGQPPADRGGERKEEEEGEDEGGIIASTANPLHGPGQRSRAGTRTKGLTVAEAADNSSDSQLDRAAHRSVSEELWINHTQHPLWQAYVPPLTWWQWMYSSLPKHISLLQRAAVLVQFVRDGEPHEFYPSKRALLCYALRSRFATLFKAAAVFYALLRFFERPYWTYSGHSVQTSSSLDDDMDRVYNPIDQVWQDQSVFPRSGLPIFSHAAMIGCKLPLLLILLTGFLLEIGYKESLYPPTWLLRRLGLLGIDATSSTSPCAEPSEAVGQQRASRATHAQPGEVNMLGARRSFSHYWRFLLCLYSLLSILLLFVAASDPLHRGYLIAVTSFASVTYILWYNKRSFAKLLILVRILPRFSLILLLLLLLVLLFAGLGPRIFHLDQTTVTSRSDSQSVEGDDDYFTTFSASVWAVFVAITSSDYPNQIMPSYERSRQVAFYFISFISLGAFGLLNLIIVIVLIEFQRSSQLRSDLQQAKRQILLIQAFTLLDSRQGKGYITRDEVMLLLDELTVNYQDITRAGIPVGKARLLLVDILDIDADGVISLSDFLFILDILKIKLRKQQQQQTKTKEQSPEEAAAEAAKMKGAAVIGGSDGATGQQQGRGGMLFFQQIQRFLSTWLYPSVERWVHHVYYEVVVDLVTAFLIIGMLCVNQEDLYTPSTSSIVITVLVTLCYTVSLTLKGCVRGWRLVWTTSFRSRVDLCLTAILLLSLIIDAGNRSLYQATTATVLEQIVLLLRLFLLPRNLRILFAFSFTISTNTNNNKQTKTNNNNHTLVKLSKLMRRILSRILTLSIVFLCVGYAFASCGLFLYGGLIYYTNAASPFLSSHYVQNDFYALNFNDFASSIITLFCCLKVSDFDVITTGFTSTTTIYARCYFLAWYCVGVLLLLNVLKSFILSEFLALFYGPSGGSNDMLAAFGGSGTEEMEAANVAAVASEMASSPRRGRKSGKEKKDSHHHHHLRHHRNPSARSLLAQQQQQLLQGGGGRRSKRESSKDQQNQQNTAGEGHNHGDDDQDGEEGDVGEGSHDQQQYDQSHHNSQSHHLERYSSHDDCSTFAMILAPPSLTLSSLPPIATTAATASIVQVRKPDNYYPPQQHSSRGPPLNNSALEHDLGMMMQHNNSGSYHVDDDDDDEEEDEDEDEEGDGNGGKEGDGSSSNDHMQSKEQPLKKMLFAPSMTGTARGGSGRGRGATVITTATAGNAGSPMAMAIPGGGGSGGEEGTAAMSFYSASISSIKNLDDEEKNLLKRRMKQLALGTSPTAPAFAASTSMASSSVGSLSSGGPTVVPLATSAIPLTLMPTTEAVESSSFIAQPVPIMTGSRPLQPMSRLSQQLQRVQQQEVEEAEAAAKVEEDGKTKQGK